MDPILIPIAVTGAFLLGGVLWKYVFCEQARHKRTLRRATRRPISEIKDGEFAKVVGRLRLAETPPLEAPLTSRPCAYFEVKVEERQSSGRSSHWETIVQTMESQETIFVEDDSGKALVTLAAPQVVLHMDTHLESGFLNDASPRLEAFLARHGHSSEGWVFNKTIRYTEGVLEEGEQVAVLGHCVWEPDPDPPAGGHGAGYREMPMRLHITDAGEEQMIVSDDLSVH